MPNYLLIESFYKDKNLNEDFKFSGIIVPEDEAVQASLMELKREKDAEATKAFAVELLKLEEEVSKTMFVEVRKLRDLRMAEKKTKNNITLLQKAAEYAKETKDYKVLFSVIRALKGNLRADTREYPDFEAWEPKKKLPCVDGEEVTVKVKRKKSK
jgi:hypothetical protein